MSFKDWKYCVEIQIGQPISDIVAKILYRKGVKAAEAVSFLINT